MKRLKLDVDGVNRNMIDGFRYVSVNGTYKKQVEKMMDRMDRIGDRCDGTVGGKEMTISQVMDIKKDIFRIKKSSNQLLYMIQEVKNSSNIWSTSSNLLASIKQEVKNSSKILSKNSDLLVNIKQEVKNSSNILSKNSDLLVNIKQEVKNSPKILSKNSDLLLNIKQEVKNSSNILSKNSDMLVNMKQEVKNSINILLKNSNLLFNIKQEVKNSSNILSTNSDLLVSMKQDVKKSSKILSKNSDLLVSMKQDVKNSSNILSKNSDLLVSMKQDVKNSSKILSKSSDLLVNIKQEVKNSSNILSKNSDVMVNMTGASRLEKCHPETRKGENIELRKVDLQRINLTETIESTMIPMKDNARNQGGDDAVENVTKNGDTEGKNTTESKLVRGNVEGALTDIKQILHDIKKDITRSTPDVKILAKPSKGNKSKRTLRKELEIVTSYGARLCKKMIHVFNSYSPIIQKTKAEDETEETGTDTLEGDPRYYHHFYISSAADDLGKKWGKQDWGDDR